MDDSDSDYVDSDGDARMDDGGMASRTRSKGKGQGKNKRQRNNNKELQGASGGYAWEDELHRSWDVVKEDAGGSLAGVVAGIVEESKKKRVLKDTTPVQRGIIRNLVLVLDLSLAMLDKDLRPNRYQLTLNNAIEFVTLFFDENPISQLGIVGMREGIAVLVSEVDGNPNEHISKLQALKTQDPKGDPSLQNALEMTRGMLFHVPSHCTKECVIVFGALLSSDPGDIHKTIKGMVEDKIRARVIGLSAQVAVCQELTKQTNYGDTSNYGVALNDTHFKELMVETATPLAINSSMAADNSSTLVEMGFPSRISEVEPSMCACHSKLTQGEYLCPRCKAKICSLPMVCPCCNLTLILSTHLARSYHHLFPLRAFKHASDQEAALSTHCFGCQERFPQHDSSQVHTSKYICQNCYNHFCIDCDVYCHDTLHNCPGCESRQFRKKPTTLKLKM